jgi:cytochrome c-type biogenesis protein CcmE
MKARHKRAALVAAAVGILALAAWLVLSAFQQNMVFFFTPTQVRAGQAPTGTTFRIGGMVEAGSLRRHADGVTVSFTVTDMAETIAVRYQGILPDLFKEQKGVVAQGKLDASGLFTAEQVLAKHDENYMPPEAAYALEKAQQDGTPRAVGATTKGAY